MNWIKSIQRLMNILRVYIAMKLYIYYKQLHRMILAFPVTTISPSNLANVVGILCILIVETNWISNGCLNLKHERNWGYNRYWSSLDLPQYKY